jgi:hypothetical protein
MDRFRVEDDFLVSRASSTVSALPTAELVQSVAVSVALNAVYGDWAA